MSSVENCAMDTDVPGQSTCEQIMGEPMCMSEDENTSPKKCDGTSDEASNSKAVHSETSKGVSITDLHQGYGHWGPPPLPPVQPSSKHAVLYKLPWRKGHVPEPFPAVPCDRWDQEHVRMPNSSESLYPVQETEDEKGLRLRWELVQEALLCNIMSSHQLESAILSYNSRYNERWNFRALHVLFSEVLTREESEYFFREVLPQMVSLALRLPDLVTGPIPLLRKHRNHSISLSQLQIGSILANAFFCTFPRRNSTKKGSEYAAYPDINFNRLFQCGDSSDSGSTYEKLKCIINYFRRICASEPQGVVTFSRRHIPPGSFPNWSKSSKPLPKFHITSTGCIEDEGAGMLQVDFANKFVGGGVLGWGCVQEEIRFVICPELIISRLFTECLDSTEALIIVGCERFSSYIGYGHTFEWLEDFVDPTPFDCAGRRHCSIVAMDALCFSHPSSQYTLPNITREVNKAYVGFCETEDHEGSMLAPVATGNWGCGAFRGDANLKALLQLMAAGEACRSLVYFTFGDHNLCDRIFRMYNFLVDHSVTVGNLWNLLTQYSRILCAGNSSSVPDLYDFLHSSVLDATLEKDLKPNISLNKTSTNRESVSKLKLNKCRKGSANNSNKMDIGSGISTGKGLTEDQLDNLIEEFDSEPETMEESVVPEPSKKSDLSNAGGSSCLSLIEEGLQSNQCKKKTNSTLKNLQSIGHQNLTVHSEPEAMKEAEVAEPCKKSDFSNASSTSCLGLIEEDLQKDQSKRKTNPFVQTTKSESHQNSPTLSTKADTVDDTRTDLALKPENLSKSGEIDVQSTESYSVNLNSELVEQFSTPTQMGKDEANAVTSSSLQSSVTSQKRNSAPKRKISDYYSPV